VTATERDAARNQERSEQARELAEVVWVKPTGDDTFRGDTPDWFGERVFGGVIVAEALSAMVQTVDDEGMRAHSLHGYFLRPAVAGTPVDLRVARLRDGRTFRTRQVEMRQGDRTVCVMSSSFHADEPGDEYQLAMGEVPAPEDLPAPAAEDEPPGPFEIRSIGATPRRPDGTYQSTRRIWCRCAPGLPDDDSLHTCVAGFLSDMTETSFRPYSLGEWGGYTDASLDHAVWFHRPFRVDEWLLFDLHALINTGGRSVVRGALYRQDGQLCLSMAQELLIRPLSPPPTAPPQP
jgi:acyl-CoA thioesterase-2